MNTVNKRKIINDPVYGFIKIPQEDLYKIIQHPYMQRLRRINQLGLTNYVYPGANHSRFEHVLGAMHLMDTALQSLEDKGMPIGRGDKIAALAAILMHDIGHGPFSHTLENSFFDNVPHEFMSLEYMRQLNVEFGGILDTAISVFQNQHPKKFLHQLVSGQLDTDRLDYLRRDSFYTGVSEGVIGSDRIIKMLDVRNSEIVVEEKGIYSIEKFLVARRIMYWQVYLHKTVVAAEQMLIKILKRARAIAGERALPAGNALLFFLTRTINKENLHKPDSCGRTAANCFAKIDDTDIIYAIKQWAEDKDKILSQLANRIINRNLLKIKIQNHAFDLNVIHDLKQKIKSKYKLSDDEAEYLVFTDKISNKAYSIKKNLPINILLKNGDIKDIADASDISNIKSLSETVEKHFLCYPET